MFIFLPPPPPKKKLIKEIYELLGLVGGKNMIIKFKKNKGKKTRKTGEEGKF